MINEQVINCNNCDLAINVNFYDVIHLNPISKQKLFNHETFMIECPKCHHKISLNYDCLFIDENNDYVLAYCQKDESKEKVISLFQSDKKDYLQRIVKNQKELIEKIYIFDEHLNDYVIEIMKAMHKIGLLKEFGSDSDIEIYFSNEGENHFVIMMDKETYSYPFEEDFYQGILSQYENEMELTFKEVDYHWAIKEISDAIGQ